MMRQGGKGAGELPPACRVCGLWPGLLYPPGEWLCAPCVAWLRRVATDWLEEDARTRVRRSLWKRLFG